MFSLLDSPAIVAHTHPGLFFWGLAQQVCVWPLFRHIICNGQELIACLFTLVKAGNEERESLQWRGKSVLFFPTFIFFTQLIVNFAPSYC